MGFLYFRDFCCQVPVWHLPREKNQFKKSIIGQENHLLSHKILVAINIHTQQPAMNHD